MPTRQASRQPPRTCQAVGAAAELEQLLLEGLDPHADPGDPQAHVAAQAGGVKSARVRLDRDLGPRLDAKPPVQLAQQLLQQRQWQKRGRACGGPQVSQVCTPVREHVVAWLGHGHRGTASSLSHMQLNCDPPRAAQPAKRGPCAASGCPSHHHQRRWSAAAAHSAAGWPPSPAAPAVCRRPYGAGPGRCRHPCPQQ